MIKGKKGAGIWAEGKYIDLWSLVHFIGGGLLAGILLFFGFSLIAGFIISFAILFGWEIIEMVVDIEEHPANIVSDMIVGPAGFLAIWFLMKSNITNKLYLFVILAVLFIALDVHGYYKYTQKRNKKR